MTKTILVFGEVRVSVMLNLCVYVFVYLFVCFFIAVVLGNEPETFWARSARQTRRHNSCAAVVKIREVHT